MLLSFAVELNLKSVLFHHGHAESELNKAGTGHNLTKLFDMAKEYGFNDDWAGVLVAPLHEHHHGFGYRYTKADSKYHVHDIDIYFSAMPKLDDAVNEIIGASKLNGLNTGIGWAFPKERSTWRT